MSTHSGSIWTVRCASSSTSPSCGQSHGPIASSIPLRAAAQLLGGNASDPEAQSLGACPSRGKFTSRIARHGQSDDPRANVSSVGPCTEDHSDQLLASVEAACDPCDRDDQVVSDLPTAIGRRGGLSLIWRGCARGSSCYLIGAATILGCLQYGLGYLQHSHLEMSLWEESRMLTAL